MKETGKENFNLTLTDSYKASHINAYKNGVKRIQSYLESRGGKYEWNVFFGLQYYLKRFLEGAVVTQEKIDEAEKFWSAHFGRNDVFNRKAWEYIINKHGGKLPVRIRAVPEGTRVNFKNVLMTIENTDDECFWLVNFLETLLMKVWYPITIASQSATIKNDIRNALERSGDVAGAEFKCHDFAYRGVASEEMAAIGAAAHLISFKGTDTVAGIRLLQDYYNSGMCGFSIPATEHSVICSFGRVGEEEACENFLNQYPSGLIACVSDTYDIYNCCENIWGGTLKNKVMSRDGTLVIRPDSGDFFEVVPKVLEILWRKFGGVINEKGFKVLDNHVRVIQGDGMNPTTIQQLFERIMELGWSADNLAVGSGGGLLMAGIDRDTNKFAIKANAALIGSEWVDIFKEPVTDIGKKSKRGRLKLVKKDNGFETVRESEFGQDILETVFENGELVKEYTFDEVRKNAAL